MGQRPLGPAVRVGAGAGGEAEEGPAAVPHTLQPGVELQTKVMRRFANKRIFHNHGEGLLRDYEPFCGPSFEALARCPTPRRNPVM